MVSLKDVAREAGLSVSTVSAVLGGRSEALGIKEETRAKALDVANRLGYRRNEAARSMVTGQSRIVCMMTPSLAPEYYSLCAEGAIEAASESGMFLKIAVWKGADNFGGVLRHIMEIKPLGLICRGLRPPELRALDAELKINPAPVILMDAHPGRIERSAFVTFDDFSGFKQILERLRGLGRKKIAYLAYPPDIVPHYMRVESFMLAAKETAVDFDPRNLWLSTHGNVKETAQKFCRMKNRPDAVVCSADGIAYCFVKELERLGVKVPGDVSVTGYGNTPCAQYGSPSLTTVIEPYLDAGAAALKTLLRINSALGRKISAGGFDCLIPVSLVPGQTTGEEK